MLRFPLHAHHSDMCLACLPRPASFPNALKSLLIILIQMAVSTTMCARSCIVHGISDSLRYTHYLPYKECSRALSGSVSGNSIASESLGSASVRA